MKKIDLSPSKIISSFFVVWIMVITLAFMFYFPGFTTFFNNIENKAFDTVQKFISKYKKTSNDIVILTIDDESYEKLTKKYGQWPIPREVYAKLIDNIEKENPKLIALDLMFVQSTSSTKASDEKLILMFKKYNNIITAMNFDDHDENVRTPIKLPLTLSASLISLGSIDFNNKLLEYKNVRAILPGIINSTKNIGHINVNRDNDGIIRHIMPFVKYKNNFYPHFALKTLDVYYNNNSSIYNINRQGDLIINESRIPINKEGYSVLNWYSNEGKDTIAGFKAYSIYHILDSIEKRESLEKYNLRNKLIFVGSTASSLYDVKSVPIAKNIPGVILSSTFVNNALDNSFIKKLSVEGNVALTLILCILITAILTFVNSTVISLSLIVTTIILYIIVTLISMLVFNLWLDIALPVVSMFLIALFTYIYKYMLTARDLEYTYKLATTDVMTNLYNHRYFQEQLILNVQNSKRYETPFSLLLLDIDFFKKFNDTYGHQAGDAILKQVAKIIKTNVRSTDIPCRYGGEEMSVILTNTDLDEALITAKKLCDTIANTSFFLKNNNIYVNVTVSIGVSTISEDINTPDKMIRESDKFLYKAKENGRNQVGNYVKE